MRGDNWIGKSCIVRAFAFCLLSYAVSKYGCNASSLKIAAFNIQVLGVTKMSKPEVVEVLVDIISLYDVILIQEIRDASETAIVELLDQVNMDNTDKPFSMKISPRLGRTSSKEQYAYFYRTNSGLTVTDDYVFDDGNETAGTDLFEREPYIVKFKSIKTDIEEFAFIGIHVSPGTAVEEINQFENVFNDVRDRMNTDDIVLMGDLNADCSYVSNSAWNNIPIKSDSRYTWLIPDDADTTVSGTNCAYDRFIMTGTTLGVNILNGSASVFKFDATYGLNNSFAADVSDHYPIQFELKVKKGKSSGGRADMSTSMSMFFVCISLVLHVQLL